MSEDERLDELLDQYQDLLESGQVPDLAWLCRECPDLLPKFQRRIAMLNRIGEVLEPNSSSPADTSQQEPIPLSLSDDKTWVGRSEVNPPSRVEIPAPPGYEILAPLGEGGMGIVYKARQIGLNRLVALKMILAGTRARAIELARFRDEAQAIASLRHPNIVQVHEIGVHRNQPFFSLEFCPGSTLAKALKGEPQLPGAAAMMTEVLARAMDYAHSCGIVHRDLKPANVLLSSELGSGIADPTTLGHSHSDLSPSTIPMPSSSFKITDFGLAKRVDDDSGKTQDGSVIGTPSYMAPEQAFGKIHEIGPTTDIHALGAMLYEFLTGRPPFKGSTVHETLEQVRHRDPVPVRELQPKVPRDLETICLKCLQKEPRKRYPTALALAEDLERYRSGKPIKARPISRGESLWRWCRREPGTAAMVASLGLFIVSMPALFAWTAARLSTAEQVIDVHRQATQAAVREQKAARDAEEALRYHSGVNDVRRLHSERRPGWTWDARERLQAMVNSGSNARDLNFLRSEWVATRSTLDLRPTAKYAKGVAPGAVAFSKDGRLAITPFLVTPLLSLRAVILIDPKSGHEQRLPFSAPVPRDYKSDRTQSLLFSPDGRWLVLGLRSGAVIRWDLSQPDPKRVVWEAHEGSLLNLTFSSDSKWLYSAGKQGEVRKWPVGNGLKTDALSKARKLPGELGSIAYWEHEPAGLMVHGAGGTSVLNPETLEEMTSSTTHRNWVPPGIPGSSQGRLAIQSTNGTVIVGSGRSLNVWYWQHGISRDLGSLCDSTLDDDSVAHAGSIEGLALHPGEDLLASASPTEGLVKLWCLSTLKLLASIPAVDCRAIAFDPSGKWLAAGGDHITTLYELSGFQVQSVVARRGLTIRAFGHTHQDRLTTIASRPFPNNADQASSVISVWDPDNKIRDSILQRQIGRSGERECVASDATTGTTIWVPGDRVIHQQTALGTIRITQKPWTDLRRCARFQRPLLDD